MSTATGSGSLLSRTLILVYGVASYVIGVAGLLSLIAVFGHFMPFGFLGWVSPANPILSNLVLVLLWGFIHSAMARSSFKGVLTRMIPEPAERPTYVLVSGITSILLAGWWQSVAGTIWSITNPVAQIVIWSIFGFGWAYLLAATFAIDHFDLFGLRQVYLNFRNEPRPPLKFVKRAMYSFSRHPIQTGVLIGIWATPLMTATHFTFSLGFTIYIFVGLWFEEKDLVRDIGAPYEQYKREAGMVGPKLFKRS